MLRLQLLSPVAVIIILIINFVISAPISETFQEIDLPTDEITEDDLRGLSDGELLELERALQNKIEEFENEKNGFVEDSIAIPYDIEDERRIIMRQMNRDRRAGGRRNAIPVMGDDGAVELFPVSNNQQPIVVIEEEEEPQIISGNDDEMLQDGREFILVPEIMEEDEAGALIPEELLLQEMEENDASESQPILLTEDELDELQLRERLADLGEQLQKRAIQGF